MPRTSDYESLPIPTYEEATGSRPHSSQSFHGAQEVSHDAQRQERSGLLGASSSQRHGNYRAPTVESERSSFDSDVTSLRESEEDEALREDMEQFEVTDPEGQRRAQRWERRRNNFHKRIAILTHSLSSIHLPTIPVPRLDWLRSRMPQASPEYKPDWPIVARVFGLMLIVAFVYAMFALKIFGTSGPFLGQHYNPESVRAFVQGNIDRGKIEAYMNQVTYDAHVAGTRGDFFLAEYVEQHFNAAKLDKVSHEDYYVYLNYPTADGRQVAIVDPPGLRWTAALEEEKVDPSAGRHQTLSFHGHSKSGNVTGPLIYANYGSREDFAWLKQQGIDITGAVVLVRYYGTQTDRALKIKAAELAGAAGCLIYSDPAEDGFRRGEVWPNGPWRPDDAVQRGGVSLTSWVVGDVLTPGWASTQDADRIPIENSTALAKIPSLPLAWRDAKVLLAGLQSQGAGLAVPEGWSGGVPDIEYRTGDLQKSPIVHLQNEQDEADKERIRNVLGRIDGVEAFAKELYVGNHRDSWCFGSVDPGSGTAVFLEVIRVFGELVSLGWRPRRTIVFASWDGEEYNLIGSTEHVEERLERLRVDAFGYLNVDVGVSGKDFRASGSPFMSKVLHRVLGRVKDPTGNDPDQPLTLLDRWNQTSSKLESLGAGSDYVAFQDMAGCSSLDFGFGGDDAAYPYHSCYESLRWMEQFGDPGFFYHGALAEVWSLLILALADEPVIPYDVENYTKEMDRYIAELKEDVDHEASRWADREGRAKPDLDFAILDEALDQLKKNSGPFAFWEEQWEIAVGSSGGMESRELGIHRITHNAQLSEFEKHLLDLPAPEENRGGGGVPGREQYKHVVFAPQRWSGYDGAYFPAIRDQVEDHNWDGAQEWVGRIGKILHLAAFKLLH